MMIACDICRSRSYYVYCIDIQCLIHDDDDDNDDDDDDDLLYKIPPAASTRWRTQRIIC